MKAAASRVEPVPGPYSPELQKVFDAIMPPGVPPLALFTTLARVPRIWDRFRAGSLLDRGPVSLRHREIVIDRTCARCGCAYEWGVHIAFFAQRVALTAEQVSATWHGDAGDPVWSDDERLLIRLADELHDSADDLGGALEGARGGLQYRSDFRIGRLGRLLPYGIVLFEWPEAACRALWCTSSGVRRPIWSRPTPQCSGPEARVARPRPLTANVRRLRRSDGAPGTGVQGRS